MSEIPDDIREKARKLAGKIDRLFSVYADSASLDYDGAEEIIARAILAERERGEAALVEADRHAAKLEALLEPHIKWHHDPDAALKD